MPQPCEAITPWHQGASHVGIPPPLVSIFLPYLLPPLPFHRSWIADQLVACPCVQQHTVVCNVGILSLVC